MTNKPITMLREDFITNLTQLINDCGLPFFVIEDTLNYFTAEMTKLSAQQLALDKQAYELNLKTEIPNDSKSLEKR